MSDGLKTLTPGDRPMSGEGPLNAAFHNAAVDAIYRDKRRSAPVRNEGLHSERDESVWVNNASGSDLAQFGVVGLGSVLSAPGTAGEDTFRNQCTFQSEAPDPESPFGILLDPIQTGPANIGRIVVNGPAKCRIEVADRDHEWAAPIAADYAKLASQAGAGPARILWRQGQVGTLLNGAINAVQTNVVVDSSADFSETPFVVTIGSEDLRVTAIDEDGVTWTCTRGYNSTTANTHADNSTVRFSSGAVWAVVNLAASAADSNFRFGLSASTISAISGNAPGFGLVAVYQIDDDGELIASGDFVIARNLCSEIPPGWWVNLHRQNARQPWMATPRCVEGVDDSDSDSEGSEGSEDPPVTACCPEGMPSQVWLCLKFENGNDFCAGRTFFKVQSAPWSDAFGIGYQFIWDNAYMTGILNLYCQTCFDEEGPYLCWRPAGNISFKGSCFGSGQNFPGGTPLDLEEPSCSPFRVHVGGNGYDMVFTETEPDCADASETSDPSDLPSDSASSGPVEISRAVLAVPEASTAGVITLSGITVEGDALLVVPFYGDADGGADTATATFDGTPMTGIKSSDGTNYVYIFYLAVPTTTIGNVVVTMAAGTVCIAGAIEVTGLPSNAEDQTATAFGSMATDPEIGATGMTTADDEYVQSVFLLRDTVDPAAAVWANSYTTGEEYAEAGGGEYLRFMEGYRVLSAMGQPNGKLDDITINKFVGLTVTFR